MIIVRILEGLLVGRILVVGVLFCIGRGGSWYVRVGRVVSLV